MYNCNREIIEGGRILDQTMTSSFHANPWIRRQQEISEVKAIDFFYSSVRHQEREHT